MAGWNATLPADEPTKEALEATTARPVGITRIALGQVSRDQPIVTGSLRLGTGASCEAFPLLFYIVDDVVYNLATFRYG